MPFAKLCLILIQQVNQSLQTLFLDNLDNLGDGKVVKWSLLGGGG